MKRGRPARVPGVALLGNRRATTPRRRALLQLWLAERPWGRIILHAWCLLFRRGEWAAARNGIGRGLRELSKKIPPRFRKRR